MAINKSNLSQLSSVNTNISPDGANLMGSAMYNKYKGTNIGKEGLAGGDLSTQINNFKSTGSGGSGGGFLQGLSSVSWGAAAGNTLANIGSSVGNYGEDFSEEQKASQSAIRGVLAMIPGYGQLIAAATGAVDAIGSMTGTNFSNLD